MSAKKWPEKSRRIIVNCMVNHGFMSDWFGIDSSEFREEQIRGFREMTVQERHEWVARNEGNLIRGIGIPNWVLTQAIQP